MSAFFNYFFLDHPRSSILGFTALYLFFSFIVGSVVRRACAEALAIGFLILAGSANLAFFIARPLGLPTATFVILVGVIAILMAVSIRKCFLAPDPMTPRITTSYVFAAGTLASMVWFTQIVMPEPSAGLSSNQVWFPLYIARSYEAGHFLTWDELGFAPGFLASIYYGPDLMGLLAFGGWFGPADWYAPFLGAAIAAGMVSFSLLSWGLRSDRVALACFVLTAIVVFRHGDWLRLVVGSNWGDVIMYAGGACVLYFLALQGNRNNALMGAAACSLFLVFSRQYGAFFTFIICLGCGAVYWRRNGWRRTSRKAIAISLFGMVFAAREVYLMIIQPTVFHKPGAHRNFDVDTIPSSLKTMLGSSDFWFEAPYRLAFIAVGLLYLCYRLARSRGPDMLAIVMPFLLIAGPVLLLLLTGFASPFSLSKVYIVALFLPLWYPWVLASQDDDLWGGMRRGVTAMVLRYRRSVAATLIIVLIASVIIAWPRIMAHRLVRDGPETAFHHVFETYRGNNYDQILIGKLRAALGKTFKRRITDHPILYLHYEPGIGLRYFAGGDFFADIDFWSDRVFRAMHRHQRLADVMAELGWPHISIGWHDGLLYGLYATDDVWKRYVDEISLLDSAPWVERRFSAGYSRFYLVREPDRQLDR